MWSLLYPKIWCIKLYLRVRNYITIKLQRGSLNYKCSVTTWRKRDNVIKMWLLHNMSHLTNMNKVQWNEDVFILWLFWTQISLNKTSYDRMITSYDFHKFYLWLISPLHFPLKIQICGYNFLSKIVPDSYDESVTIYLPSTFNPTTSSGKI